MRGCKRRLRRSKPTTISRRVVPLERSDGRGSYARVLKLIRQTGARFLPRPEKATSFSALPRIRTSNSPRKRRWNNKSRSAPATLSGDKRTVLLRRRRRAARYRRRVAAQHSQGSAGHRGKKDCPHLGTCDRNVRARFCRRDL